LINKKGLIIALISGILLILLLINILSIGIENIYYEIRLPVVGFVGLLVIAILYGLVLQFLINRKRRN